MARSISSAAAPAQGAGDALHDVGADAACGVGAGDAAGVRVLALAGRAALDVGVAGAAAADVAGGLLLDHGLQFVRLLERHDGSLDRGVGVAGTAAARVEAAHAGTGSGGDGLSRDASRGSGLRSAEEVASAAAARVREGVLRDGGVRLVDGKARHRGVV